MSALHYINNSEQEELCPSRLSFFCLPDLAATTPEQSRPHPSPPFTDPRFLYGGYRELSTFCQDRSDIK